MRICARLDLKEDYVIKGIQMEGLRKIGKISSIASEYYRQGADELILVDSTSSWFSIDAKPRIISSLIENIFVPITIGGGISDLEKADEYFDSGADKIAINTAFFTKRKIAQEVSHKYGAQALVLQLNVKRINNKHFCFIENGRTNTGLEVEQVISSLDKDEVGEIFISSIDKDGTLQEPDYLLVEKISKFTGLPYIYGGGIAKLSDCLVVHNQGISAVAIGAALHHGKLKISDLKSSLSSNGVPCRMDSNV
jgi:cyclase